MADSDGSVTVDVAAQAAQAAQQARSHADRAQNASSNAQAAADNGQISAETATKAANQAQGSATTANEHAARAESANNSAQAAAAQAGSGNEPSWIYAMVIAFLGIALITLIIGMIIASLTGAKTINTDVVSATTLIIGGLIGVLAPTPGTKKQQPPAK